MDATSGRATHAPSAPPRAQAPDAAQEAGSTAGRPWLALAFIALAQLMLALDATVVNIALPSAQADLGFGTADRQWVVTAYTLTFGGLLLLGGRVADLLGRQRAFLGGLAGFAVASAIGGAAPSFGVLVAARAGQGAFAALLAPTALSLIAVTFTAPRERAKAFAVYGAIAGSGGALGLVLGGALAGHASWRWCLYVNLVVAAVAAIGGWLFVPAGAANGGRERIDVGGAVLGSAGLATFVYSCSEAVRHGWTSTVVVAGLVVSAVLLAAFVVLERRLSAPLLPLSIVNDRNRAGAYLSSLVAVGAMFGMFLFLTYYLQVVLGWSPLRAGLAFLPLSAASFVGSGAVATRLMPHVRPRTLMAPALVVTAIAMATLTRLDADSGYLQIVLPAEILLGLGMSCVMVPAFSVATLGVDRRSAGVAAAVVNTSQQVGGSIGTAALNAVAAGATTAYVASHGIGPAARTAGLVHGYGVAAGTCAVALAAAAVVVGLLVNAARPEPEVAPAP